METEAPEHINLGPQNTPDNPNNTNQKNSSITLISIAAFILFCLGTVIFLYNQNKELKKIVAEYQKPTPAPIVVATPTPDPSLEVILSTPSKNSLVTSPLLVKGTVPAGWMFEGVIGVKLVDSNGKLIKTARGEEINPGSWLSGNPVEFTSTLTFKTTANSGSILIESDNASGDPKKVRYFSQPVTFNTASVSATPAPYTCPQGGYVDCMPGPTEGIRYECTAEAMNWYKANCPDFKGGAY